MKSVTNEVKEEFNCPSSTLFNLLTAPANWLGLHPVTKGIYGPAITRSLGVGGVAIEHIDSDERPAPFDAVWLVTRHEQDKVWELSSLYFGGQPLTVKIRYDFLQHSNYLTTFKRTMITYYQEGDISEQNLKASKSAREHEIYFDNIRKRLNALQAS